MAKRKDRRESEARYANLVRIATGATPPEESGSPRDLTRPKKFRFELLHAWMVEHLAPCRVADVGGGKGMLTYLLRQSGWEAVVIDPARQDLPGKYRASDSEERVFLGEEDRVPRLDRPFAAELAREFDLLVAMHAHGCIMAVIEAAAEHDRCALVLPCCVIEEPIVPPPGVDWLACVLEHALDRGFRAQPFRLNFKGQNIGLYLTRR
jgi:hypothetical protein